MSGLDRFDTIQGGLPNQDTPSENLGISRFDTISAAGTPKINSAPTPLGSDTQNFFSGVAKAAVDTTRGAKQLMDIPAQWLENKFPGISSWSQAQGMPSAKASAAQTNSDVAASRVADAPLMNTKAGIAGNIAGTAAMTMAPLGALASGGNAVRGAGVARALLNPSTYGAAAASGALSGALQPVTGDESRLENTAVGSAFGLGGNLAVNTIGRIAQPVANVLSTAHAKAVSTLQAAGIPLDVAQQTGSSFANKVRSSFTDNPFTSGAQGDLARAQQQGYNRAVLSTMGESANSATPDVMGAASKRINGVFGDVLSRNDIAITDPVASKIAAVQAAATEEEKMPVSSIANRLMGAVGPDGKIPGQIAYNIKKDLDRIASSPDTTLGFHARQLRSVLMDSINDSLPSADQSAFSEARNQFSNMKKIEPTIDRMGNGDISAPKLASVMAQKANRSASIYGRGDQQLVDLAHSGNLLLPDKMPNSGTPGRMAMQIALPLVAGGAEGAYTGDWENAAKTAIGLAAIPKAAQYLMNNPTTSKYLSNGMQGNMTPLKNLLQLPQSNIVVGGAMRRIPDAFYNKN